jgi:hypothetical protein
MTTLQEYLDEKYPTKEDKEKVKKINSSDILNELYDKEQKENENKKNDNSSWFSDFYRKIEKILLIKRLKKPLEGKSLDLSDFFNLEEIRFENTNLEYLLSSDALLDDLKLHNLSNLKKLNVEGNKLTQTDFLNHLPNPEKLTELSVSNNNIQPTDIEIFSKFVNLTKLRIGTSKDGLEKGKKNKFHGSLKSLQNLNKLEELDIESADIDSGLEYLPENLLKSITQENNKKKAETTSTANTTEIEVGGYCKIKCSPHNTNAECKAIYDQLKPYNYDVKDWQISNYKLMEKAHEWNTDRWETWEQELERIKRIRERVPVIKVSEDSNSITLQQHLEKKYPTKEIKEGVKEILVCDHRIFFSFRRTEVENYKVEGGVLDLSEFTNLKEVNIMGDWLRSPIIAVNLRGLKHLSIIKILINDLVSVDFLKRLSNPEVLKILWINDNNIQPTTLDFLRPFVNLEDCRLGENGGNGLEKYKEKYQKRFKTGTYNKFYGSLEPIRDLTKLEQFCIAGTDIDSGLEYIPYKIAKESKGRGKDAMFLNLIDCQPLREDAKIKKIQDQLRVFDYDIEAWQLAHPNLMKLIRGKSSTEEEIERIRSIECKLTESKMELKQLKETKELEKEKKIQRIESKIEQLEKELVFLAQENRELRTTIREMEQNIFNLTQKLEQTRFVSQFEVQPK